MLLSARQQRARSEVRVPWTEEGGGGEVRGPKESHKSGFLNSGDREKINLLIPGHYRRASRVKEEKTIENFGSAINQGKFPHCLALISAAAWATLDLGFLASTRPKVIVICQGSSIRQGKKMEEREEERQKKKQIATHSPLFPSFGTPNWEMGRGRDFGGFFPLRDLFIHVCSPNFKITVNQCLGRTITSLNGVSLVWNREHGGT